MSAPARTPFDEDDEEGGGDGSNAGSGEVPRLDAPMPFVTVGEDGKFILDPGAVRYLQSLTGRVGVVCVAGQYRSGKSYLLNTLVNAKEAPGFAVGSSVKACTKGIWLWGRSVPSPSPSSDPDDGMTILFMDTEGLGSTVRSETYDSRVFALALLLCSYFIYNSVGTIDGNAIAKLSLVVNLTKTIHVRSHVGAGGEDSGQEFSRFFPSFLWCVRDFGVKLERDGRRITSREYLEQALQPEDGLSEAAEQKNLVRALVRSFFPDRDCVTMVRPVLDEKALASLPSLPWDALRPEFRAQVEALRRKVLSAVRPKSLFGKPVNGAMLAGLAESYVSALNAGATPTINTAWDRVVTSQCQAAVEAGVAAYGAAMAAAMSGASSSSSSQALEEEALHTAHVEAFERALAAFSSAAVQDADRTPPYEAALRGKVEAQYSRFRAANAAASGAQCEALLEGLLAAAAAKHMSPEGLRKGRLTSSGGAAAGGSGGAAAAVATATEGLIPAATVAKAYRTLVDTVVEQYSAAAAGPAKHRVLADFLSGARGAGGGAVTAQPVASKSAALARFFEDDDDDEEEGKESARSAVLAAPAARGRMTAGTASGAPAHFLSALLDGCLSADDSAAALSAALQARVTELGGEVTAARGRERATGELLDKERKGFQATLAEASRVAAEEAAKLKLQLEAKTGELERLQSRYDKLLAVHEAAVLRADEAATAAAAALADRNARLDAALSARADGLLEAALVAQRLADAEAMRAEAEALVGELRSRLAEEAAAASVLLERVRGAENETVRLREQTELLYESVRVQKDLVAAKHEEKEECEFQWGVTKARLAQAESERVAAESDFKLLRDIARVTKAQLIKTGGKNALKGLAFAPSAQRIFDALGTGGGAGEGGGDAAGTA